MDSLFEDSCEDRLIEDYLFAGYRPASKSTFDIDHQFAKPIEDEDLFGVDGQNNESTERNCFDEDFIQPEKSPKDYEFAQASPEDTETEGICEKNNQLPDSLSPKSPLDTANDSPAKDTDKPRSELDDIFIDDYSDSSKDHNIKSYGKSSTNNENNQPSGLKTPDKSKSKPPPAPTPTQIKMMRMKQMFLEQAIAMSAKPKPLGSGFNSDGTIEVTIEQNRLVSDTNSKFIFNKMFNKSKKANDSFQSPENIKRSWRAQSDSLKKRLCAQKRKIWDTFQRPVDDFDDEEELIELPEEKKSKKEDDEEKEKDYRSELGDEDDIISSRLNEDEDDGNFEDLEREDRASGTDDEEGDVQSEPEDVKGKEDEADDLESVVSSPDKEKEEGLTDDEILEADSDDELEAEEFGEVDRDQESSEIDDRSKDSFNLNLDDDSSKESERDAGPRRRRAIFIDDEASED